MANLWKQLVEKLGYSKKARQRLGAHTRRALRMEALEKRQLMAFSITGVVFTDLTDNGTVDVADPKLGGVTVGLYTAGGNNVFDNGTGDDVLVTTTTSAATTGRFTFSNITTAGTYFVQQNSTVSGQVQRASARFQQVIVTQNQVDGIAGAPVGTVDTFNSPTTAIAAIFGGTNPDSNSTATAEALGGIRDIFANASVGTIDLTVDTSNNNALNASPQPGADGQFLFTYDGDGTNANNALGTQLGTGTNNYDLTAAGAASAFRLLIGAPNGVNTSTLTVRVSGVGGTSTVTKPIPASPTGIADQTMVIDFGELVGSTDLTQVGAIQFEINQDNSDDTQVDLVETFLNQAVANLANLNPMTIGNFVFLDRNNNGTFDSTGANPDVGIGGVDLELYNDVNSNQQFDAGTDTAVTVGTATTTTSTTTGSVGRYTFTGLLPGNYIVLVPASEFGTGQPLVSRVSSTGVTTADTDNTDHGAPVTGAIGSAVFAAVALTAAGEPINDTDTDANTNLTVDFGFAPPTLTFTKTDTPDPVRTGDPITYTLTVTNTSPFNSTNTTITDPLPTGVTFVSGTYVITSPNGTGGNASNASNTVTANVGTLLPGQIATLTIIGTVGAGFTGTTLSNDASVTNTEGSIATANAPTAIVPRVDLGIDKIIVGGGTTIGVGEALTYRLTLTNNTAVTVTNIRVDDDLPAGFTQGVLPSGVATGTAPADLVWTIATLGPNASVTVDIPVTVGTSVTPGNFVNSTTIRTDLLTGFNDDITGNNQDTVSVTVEPRFNLLITKDDGVTTATTGNLLTYTLAINNSGPSAATNVAVSDILPAQLQFVSANINGTSFGTPNGQTFSGTIPTIASGATVNVSLIVRVLASATGTSIINTATITPETPANEIAGRSNTATDTDTLVRTVTLNIDKTDSTDTVIAGGANFTYTITAFNSGSADAPNVLFSDPLPTGVNFVSGTFATNETVPRTGTVTFNSTTNRLEANLGTLLAGGSATVNRALITLTVNAAATAVAGQISNTATLTSPDNTVGVTDTETTNITRSFDVTVTKSVDRTTVRSGEQLVYTIIVSNSGPSTATGVTVSDILPTNVTFVSATSAAGTFNNTNGTVSGTIASLASGSPATITLTATVNNNTPNATAIVNPVTVTATGESNTNNNSGSATVTVANTANLSGQVYIDTNRNGIRDTGEAGVPNVTITATGTAAVGGAAITRTTTTAPDGSYSFADLPLGTYTVTQTQPVNFDSVATNPGTINNVVSGTAATNVISNINLTGNSIANGFGLAQVVSKRLLLASAQTPVVAVGNNSIRSMGAFRRS